MVNSPTQLTQPWHQKTLRWCQTNLTLPCPEHCDVRLWKDYWQRNAMQGIIANAGGIIAYYPTMVPHHKRSPWLKDHDLYGEFSEAARDSGMAVLARMDSSRGTPELYDAHPDWFFTRKEGSSNERHEWYFSCVNSPYYTEYLTQILLEIIQKYKPDGFTDNSWGGVGKKAICYCPHCREKFFSEESMDLPAEPNWNDPVYRRWIRWSYRKRLEAWDFFNEFVQTHGGKDCLWLGMVNADPINSHVSFCDLRKVAKKAPIIMCDHQSRGKSGGFEQNSLNGKLLNGLVGWDKHIPESMATYVRGKQTFRLASNPAAETETWMLTGISAGLSPWKHHIGASHEDQRQYETGVDILRWHSANEQYLHNRQLYATVAMVWSQDNIDFYGRDDREKRVSAPWRGFAGALQRKTIPFHVIHADDLDNLPEEVTTLILPEFAAISDSQIESIRNFVLSGGNVVATGITGALNEEGLPRETNSLMDLFGLAFKNGEIGTQADYVDDWEIFSRHSYLRIPHDSQASDLYKGLSQTTLLPAGGILHPFEIIDPENTETLYSFIPAFPVYPPEFASIPKDVPELAAITSHKHTAGGRLVWIAADIDRCYGQQHLPDHAQIIANLVRHSHGKPMPIELTSPGFIDAHIFQQGKHLLIHLVNLSGTCDNSAYREEFLPVGPIQITLHLPDSKTLTEARCLVAECDCDLTKQDKTIVLTLSSIEKHELIKLI